MNYGYLVVEGPHDIEFVGCLLKKVHKLKRIVKNDELDSYWNLIIPKTFPPDGDLRKRMPVPAFFQNDNFSIALHSAIGDSRIIRTLTVTLSKTDLAEDVVGIGIIIDADYGEAVAKKRFDSLKKELEKNLAELVEWPGNPGEILTGKPNRGIFVFPDNMNEGTLETVLLKCAKNIYPRLCETAETFINDVDINDLTSKDKQDIKKPSGKNKATVGCIGNVLRPGKAIQVSIEDNKWIGKETLIIPEVNAVNQFLKELFNLP